MYFLVIYDDRISKREFIGKAKDDTFFIENLDKFRKAGLQVRGQALDEDPKLSETLVPGYAEQVGIYEKLITEYEKITGVQFKRW